MIFMIQGLGISTCKKTLLPDSATYTALLMNTDDFSSFDQHGCKYFEVLKISWPLVDL